MKINVVQYKSPKKFADAVDKSGCLPVCLCIIYKSLLVLFYADRNLNPKAACLKRREEEKALRLTSVGDISISSEYESLLASQSSLTSSAVPQLTYPQMPSVATSPMSLPLSQTTPTYTSSPSPLGPGDKIPRKSDPPMKKRLNSGNISPTLRRNRAHLQTPSLVTSSPGYSDRSQGNAHDQDSLTST